MSVADNGGVSLFALPHSICLECGSVGRLCHTCENGDEMAIKPPVAGIALGALR